MAQVQQFTRIVEETNADGEVLVHNIPAQWTSVTGVMVTPEPGGGMSPQARVTGPNEITVKFYVRDGASLVHAPAGMPVRFILGLFGLEAASLPNQPDQ